MTTNIPIEIEKLAFERSQEPIKLYKNLNKRKPTKRVAIFYKGEELAIGKKTVWNSVGAAKSALAWHYLSSYRDIRPISQKYNLTEKEIRDMFYSCFEFRPI